MASKFQKFCEFYGKAQVATPLAPKWMKGLQKREPLAFGQFCVYIGVAGMVSMAVYIWAEHQEDEFRNTMDSLPKIDTNLTVDQVLRQRKNMPTPAFENAANRLN